MIRDFATHDHADAASTAKVILASLVSLMLSWDASIQLVGVSLNVLLAGFIGALLGIGMGAPIIPRRRLAIVAIVSAFLAAAVTAILPHVPLMGWLGKSSAAAVAMIIGFLMRWGVVAISEHMPALAHSALEWVKAWLGRGRGNPPTRSGGAP